MTSTWPLRAGPEHPDCYVSALQRVKMHFATGRQNDAFREIAAVGVSGAREGHGTHVALRSGYGCCPAPGSSTVRRFLGLARHELAFLVADEGHNYAVVTSGVCQVPLSSHTIAKSQLLRPGL